MGRSVGKGKGNQNACHCRKLDCASGWILLPVRNHSPGSNRPRLSAPRPAPGTPKSEHTAYEPETVTSSRSIGYSSPDISVEKRLFLTLVFPVPPRLKFHVHRLALLQIQNTRISILFAAPYRLRTLFLFSMTISGWNVCFIVKIVLLLSS